MEKKHKETLRSKRVFLVENVDPATIINHLIQESLINDDESEEIEALTRRREKVRRIIQKVQLRGPTAFEKFVKVLDDTGASFVADELRATAKEKANVLEGRTRAPPPFQKAPSRPHLQTDALSPTADLTAPKFEQLGQVETDAFPVDLDTSDYYQDVVVSRPVPGHAETDSHDDDDAYRMDRKPRGLALIINNRYFDPKCGMNERRGTDVDASNLAEVFKYLGFVVREAKNQSVRQMRDNMRKIAQHDHSKYNAVVVAILTHGVEGQLYGSDGELVKVQDLIQLFAADSAPKLVGKPKLFFLQACRGDDFDYGQDLPDGRINVEAILDEALGDDDGDETDSNLAVLPVEADMLIGYATVPGYVSWRNSARGSWFIQALCEVLTNYSHKEDLVSMMVRVNRRVATSFEAKGRRKQMPAPVVQLLKKLYFRPGQ